MPPHRALARNCRAAQHPTLNRRAFAAPQRSRSSPRYPGRSILPDVSEPAAARAPARRRTSPAEIPDWPCRLPGSPAPRSPCRSAPVKPPSSRRCPVLIRVLVINNLGTSPASQRPAAFLLLRVTWHWIVCRSATVAVVFPTIPNTRMVSIISFSLKEMVDEVDIWCLLVMSCVGERARNCRGYKEYRPASHGPVVLGQIGLINPAQVSNDLPQPQLCFAFGFVILNPPPVSASLKSTTEP